MKRTLPHARLTVIVVLVASLLTAACSASTGGSTAGRDGSATTAKSTGPDGKGTGDGGPKGASTDPLPDPKIELADDVVVVRRVKGKTVKGTGNDGVSFLLDGTNPDVKKLKVGSVMLLTGVGVGRVKALDDLNGDVAVTFGSVNLTELIKNGSLSWDDTAVDFNDGKVILSPDMAEVSGSMVEPAAYHRRSGNKVEGSAGDFSFSFEWDPDSSGGGGLKVELVPSKDFGGKISADVTLKPVRFGGGTKVTDGKVDFFDLDFKNMQGTAKISADLQSTVQTAAAKIPPFFKLPVSVSIPVPVAGIPFTLTFGATLQINMSFAMASNSLHGEANLTFGGPAKFAYKGGSVSLQGTRNASSDDTLKSLVGSGEVGLVVTAELPKISFGLKMLQTGAAVFLSNGMVASMTVLPAPLLCHRVQAASVVSGGIDASFLGATVTFTRKPFLDKRWTFYYPKGDKRCDGD